MITPPFFQPRCRGERSLRAQVRRQRSSQNPGGSGLAIPWVEEAILAFLAKAVDERFALHAAIYEFQKPNLLQGLVQAKQRGVDVKVIYHARDKGEKDATRDVSGPLFFRQRLDDVHDFVKPNREVGIVVSNKGVRSVSQT